MQLPRTAAIDVVIPTYNRATLLRRLLESIRTADRPPRVRVRAIVVDNNSTDATAEVVRSARAAWTEPLEYRFEPMQSKAVALNNGLSVVTAELAAMLDDDETVDRGWFAVAERMFRGTDVDFISGPYLPDWGAPAPAWLPRDYPAIIGWVEAGDRIREYGKDAPGVLLGGNAVVRTRVGESIGWFNPSLGRMGARAGSGCEDVDFFERLLAAGARGFYVPNLAIYHHIPPQRLTKRYHRRWCFHRSVAQAAQGSLRRQPVQHVLGIPRYLIGSAARAVPVLVRSAFTGRWNTSATFSRELAIWDLAGFVWGAATNRAETA